MTPHRTYPRPPIVEAVLEFRFGGSVSHDALLSAFQSNLGTRYAGPSKVHERVEVTAAIDPSSVSTSATRSRHLTLLQSDDGLRALGCGDGLFSVHVLAPYPGWKSFREQAEEAIAALSDEIRQQAVTSIVVRYIDRIGLPTPETQFSDLLSIMPVRPQRAPAKLFGFHVVTESVDEDGTVALLTLASAPGERSPTVIYDLNLQRSGAPLCSLKTDVWRMVVDKLHKRQREIFEDSITEQARETFQ